MYIKRLEEEYVYIQSLSIRRNINFAMSRTTTTTTTTTILTLLLKLFVRCATNETQQMSVGRVSDSSVESSTISTSVPSLSVLAYDFDFSSADEYGGCFFRNISFGAEIELKCFGRNLTDVAKLPETHRANVSVITIHDAAVSTISRESMQQYRRTLQFVNFFRLLELIWIEDGTFRRLSKLQSIYVRACPKLVQVPQHLFTLYLPGLKFLKFTHTSLEEIPRLDKLQTDNIIDIVDFDSNKLRRLRKHFIKIQANNVLFQNNKIEEIEDFTFQGSNIAELNVGGNFELTKIGNQAFEGMKGIRVLDLSRTSITSLPTIGLKEIETLKLQQTYSLHIFPSIYKFKYIKTALLTYPYHCCAFRFPAKHDRDEYDKFQRFKEKLQKKHCKNKDTTTPPISLDWLEVESNTLRQRTRRKREWGGFDRKINFPLYPEKMKWQNKSTQTKNDFGWGTVSDTKKTGFSSIEVPIGFGNVSRRPGDVHFPAQDVVNSGYQEGFFHTPLSNGRGNSTLEAFCGEISKNYHDVTCQPEPDAFNPCEDIMGNISLRIAVWFVVVAAVLGNFIVIVVLLSSRFKMTVSKFLMCNLACADFLMGTYLLIIAAMDLHTIGAYFNHAIGWQHGTGCQVAGFITVFASELSIFTLTVITLERWFAITYAINLNKRIRLKGAAKAMVIGWIYAITMATLPVLGISGYTRTSICLPMENKDTADIAYLITLLSINGLAFILICACYAKMYISITAQHCIVTQNDKTVAKRMALLIFTDFACWAPIAFFGLTAVAGHPLIDVTRSKILLVFFYPLNSCANPFLYAILTKQYRRDFFILLSRCGFCTNKAMKYSTTLSYMTAQRHLTATNSVNMNRSTGNTQVTVYDMNKTFKGMDSPRRVNKHASSSSNMLPDLGALYGDKKDSVTRPLNGEGSLEDIRERRQIRGMKLRGSPHPLKSTSVVLDRNDREVMNCLLTVDSRSSDRNAKKKVEKKELFILKSNKKGDSKHKNRSRNVIELKL